MRKGTSTVIAVATALCFLCFAAYAVSGTNIELHTDEWTWQAEDVATFSGTITMQGDDIDNADLSLVYQINNVEETGSVVFTAVNGKNLTTRKQKESCRISLAGNGAENNFEAMWMLPEDTESIRSFAVTVVVCDEEDNEICRGDMKVTNGDDLADPQKESVFERIRIDRYLIYLITACAVIWMLAIIRSVYLNRKNREER